MAVVLTTSKWSGTAPYIKLTVSETSSTAATSTLQWTLQYIASHAASTSVAKSYTVKMAGATVASGTYNINGRTGTHTIASGTKTINKTTSTQSIPLFISFAFNLTWSGTSIGTMTKTGAISISPITSYTVSYNANGGSGAPASQTKWHGTAITLSTTKPTRTGYSFLGWDINSSGTASVYAPGQTYSTNSNITLYAVWRILQYTVNFDANGGTGAPSAQIKTYGVGLTLPTTKPTRANYEFLGWSTSKTSTSATYVAGGTYSANAGVTLYAVWKLAYVKPRIFNLTANRCDSSGNIIDDGTYASVSFEWSSDSTISSIKMEWKPTTSESWTTAKTLTPGGTGGTIREVIGNGDANTEYAYDIRVVVSDSGGTTTSSTILSSMHFVIDIKSGGNGLAFGKTAELNDTVECDWDAKFNKPVYGKALGMDKLPRIPANSNFDNYIDPGCYAVYTNSDATTISNIPVQVAGRLEIWSSTGAGIAKEDWAYLRQRFVPFPIYHGVFERDITRDTSDAWVYGDWVSTSSSKVTLFEGSSNGTISLSNDTNNFIYLEIFYTDNNGIKGGYVKLHYPFNNNPVHLSHVEFSGESMLIRRAIYTISGTTMTPNLTNAGYYRCSLQTDVLSGNYAMSLLDSNVNYIKITKVVGHYA